MILKFKDNLKDKINKILFIYELLGPLKKMFWIAVFFMFFQAAWEGVIFTSIATFFQSVVDTTNFNGGNLRSDSFIGRFYNLYKTIPEEKRVLVGFFLVASSMFLSSLINIGIMTFRTKFSTLFMYQLRSNTFSKLCRNSLSFFDNNKKGELIQMVVNETRSCYSVLKTILDLTINVFKTTIYFIFMVMLSFKLTLIVIVVSIIFLTENYFMSRTIKRLSQIVVSMTRKLTVTTDESIQGIKHIKLFNYYKIAESSFNRSCWDADFSNRRSALMMQWQIIISHLLGLATFCILIYLSLRYSILATSLLLTYLYILQKLNRALAGTNQKYGFLNSNLPAMNKITNFLQEATKFEEKSGEFIQNELFNEKISFKNVSLIYEKDEVLDNVSFDICKGQTVALVGESGAGKTSLANLLVRLYDTTGGEILIDGVNIKDYELTFLRNKIGLLNQDTIIFNRTVRENIMMGRPDASEDEMIEAARDAYAHDFITALPDGYDTLVGDRGVKLSGGQRQRINIAQIFLKNPELMILDEATSALDTKSEQFIQRALEKLTTNHTSIIIAHRLSTVKSADKIIVLFKGRIIEQGSWDSLLETGGVFHDMVQRQAFGVKYEMASLPVS